MKEILYGSNDKEPHTETVAQLAQELYNSGLLITLVENLQLIDFEVVMDRATVVAMTPQLMVTFHLFHLGFQHCSRVCVLLAGEEGRVSDLQQHPEEADRDAQPHR